MNKTDSIRTKLGLSMIVGYIKPKIMQQFLAASRQSGKKEWHQ
jgi:hypothetical protein